MLHNQHLVAGAGSPVDVVRSLGAVQSQDFISAKWALGQRCRSTTDAKVTRQFNEGKILRTHLLRPTWHFVAPEDIRWMQELTAPRVHAFNKYNYKQLGLDDAALKRGSAVLAKALEGGKELTRREVKAAYQSAGIDVEGLRLAYLIMYVELEAIVCSGARSASSARVCCLPFRAPQARSLPRQEALAELTRRFFASHGPATIQDFAWWSSLTSVDVKKGYEDLSFHFILLDGQLVGGWKRAATPKSFTVHLNLFTELEPIQADAVSASADRLRKFLDLPLILN